MLLVSLSVVLESPGGPLSPGGRAIEDCTVVMPGGGAIGDCTVVMPGGGAIEDCTVVMPGGGARANLGCCDSREFRDGGGAIPGTPELNVLAFKPGGGVGVPLCVWFGICGAGGEGVGS